MYIELWFNQMNALEHFDQNRSQQLPLRINPNNMVNGVSNWDQEKKFFLKTWLFWFWFCALRSFALFLIVAVLVCIASKARQVRGRAWAGQHLSRLDLWLFQRPGLPNNYDDDNYLTSNNYDDNNDQNIIRNGIALSNKLLALLTQHTLITKQHIMHIACMGWMDGWIDHIP